MRGLEKQIPLEPQFPLYAAAPLSLQRQVSTPPAILTLASSHSHTILSLAADQMSPLQVSLRTHIQEVVRQQLQVHIISGASWHFHVQITLLNPHPNPTLSLSALPPSFPPPSVQPHLLPGWEILSAVHTHCENSGLRSQNRGSTVALRRTSDASDSCRQDTALQAR